MFKVLQKKIRIFLDNNYYFNRYMGDISLYICTVYCVN